MNQRPIFAADDAVVVGASTGGVAALQTFVATLPPQFAAAVLVVMHIGNHDSILPSLLARAARLPVRHARDGDVLEPGRILVAPPDFHLLVARDPDIGSGHTRVLLSRTARENHARPAIDPLFRSAAAAFGPRAIGVLLTGMLDDGTSGLQAIKACGGRAIVQSPDEAQAPDMPESAIRNVEVDRVLPVADIGPALERMLDESLAEARGRPREVPEWVRLENRFAIEESDMETLSRIGTPSTFTCPECHGTLWEMQGQAPTRFRCHTGHAFTERHLSEQQGVAVEESLWSAVRALTEKEKLLRQMAQSALSLGHAQTAADYLQQAAAAQRDGEVLRRLLVAEGHTEQSV
ncbi:chemotaxis protein CheB [Pseudoduganella umbonata]|uniref:protein-glutamate methylesterase n=1 Tax=Pseudoduganella umbonata TaxID=864828 RepID=A0A4V1EDD2_9BURK|nr:chemotaxis protein CheB [Pseudoduganella umbonata]MBB3221528.1 two-component system chemotaxis response regulator CheB [Pseudoduganella umbonata]QCP10671.1 chemotaxis protein CheB [Pseudoduganella umbonata]